MLKSELLKEHFKMCFFLFVFATKNTSFYFCSRNQKELIVNEARDCDKKQDRKKTFSDLEKKNSEENCGLASLPKCLAVIYLKINAS
jgi:hypothetical protein